ncbi:hypothetical protein ES319_D03G160000v1 [Gossypium barbadense]|uniref:Uncharacterized protein n=3 Tax=Gossypium TaxID=3633 RepID=A0A5J5S511_GOSBA|nr:hypothetical protein ES319_D03G160000v1 [Gossypium barbadense]TYG77150.1 hypothetical protein ES288_D03G171600v1 [Gossypium darwinii]TYH81006.1 hypothetical protein ES332_D03G169600v1 [Gossypium tomentosum]
MNRLLQVLWYWKLVDIVEYWKLQCGREGRFTHHEGTSPTYQLLERELELLVFSNLISQYSL